MKLLTCTGIILGSLFLMNPVSAQYISSLATQAGSPVVYPGYQNQVILRVEVEIGPNPVTLTNMQFNTNGSSSPMGDIQRFKLYYHNDSSSFDLGLAILMGTYSMPWSTNFEFLVPVGGFYTGLTSFGGMIAGKNYFWLLYDLYSGATVCNYIDAEFIGCNAPGPNVPIVQNPAGNSVIGPCPLVISEITPLPVITISPVPAQDLITVSFEKVIPNSITIELIDITGKTVATLFDGISEKEVSHFSLQHFDTGFYFIRISMEGFETTRKILKL